MDPHVVDPHWHGLIVWYFFLGGIAAGAYVMAALADLFGSAEDRRGVRVAYYLAFPLVNVCGVLLIVDLGRPERFWHMLIQNQTGWPMLKWWSPMSAGAWALAVFGGFSFASFVGVLAADGWLGLGRFSELADRLRTGWTGRLFAAGGAASAFFLASYTGVLLAASNQPIWADTTWTGALFLASAASTGVAAMLLGIRWRCRDVSHEVEERLERLDSWAMVLELALLGLFTWSLGTLAWRAYGMWPGVLIPAVVVPLGLVLPLAVRATLGRRGAIAAAVLALVGGFALRAAVVGSSEGFLVGPPSGVAAAAVPAGDRIGEDRP
jgi:formate-dependent nitrite reductase membrane component NrfD